MTKSAWLSLGLAGCVVVACGGNVSLGEIGSSLNGPDDTDASSNETCGFAGVDYPTSSSAGRVAFEK
ncbi:MAG: hypothetical protein KF819_05890 [Labilithrix sp.]|nr:hypothetical protein [Labilithrix sp.]